MYIPFQEISDSSKVWVYLCNRKFSEAELLELHVMLKNFVEQWTAHKQDLKASFDIYEDCVIILSVDQSSTNASGCSIDSSVKLIREIEAKFDVELFNRNIVAYQYEGRFKINTLNRFKELVTSGEVRDNTIVLNTLIESKGEMNSNFAIPLSKSWHQQLI